MNSWDVENIALHGAKVVKELNPEAFCEPEKRLVIFPDRLPLQAAKDKTLFSTENSRFFVRCGLKNGRF